jgi:hypothetical protein
MAVLGEEEPYPNAVQAANITCAGILSHESALRGGQRIDLPEWTFLPNNQPTVIPLDETREPAWAGIEKNDLGVVPSPGDVVESQVK